MKKSAEIAGGRPGVRAGAAFVLVSVLGGCATGLSNVVIDLQAYEPPRSERAAPASALADVRVEAVRDARSDTVGSLIGERTTIGNITMGMVEMKPIPTVLMARVLRTELTRMGANVVDSGEQFRVGARLTKFQLTTPATPIYWDLNGAIDLELAVTDKGGTRHHARYSATCTDRTYLYPSEELIGNVIAACVDDIGAKVRGDTALTGLLRTR
ncbi:MAG: YajG family lipoprotein [Candidatus Binatia bacterium]